MTDIRFGTDGWRGLIAHDFTFDNVALCAQGLASYLRKRGGAGKKIVVGHDTRFASHEFAQCVAEVLAGNGLPVLFVNVPAPTPVLTYQVLHHELGGAVIITASHNSFLWNGFKFKPHYAGPATTEITDSIEEEIRNTDHSVVSRIGLADARQRGLLEEVDSMEPYLSHLRRLVDLPALSSAGMCVVLDAMYGAGAGYLPALIGGGSTRLKEVHTECNPAFPDIAQPEPIQNNLGYLAQVVVENKADVGIAFDGDADRLGIIDEKGRFITPLQVFALLALYVLEIEKKRGPLVKSITATSMIHRMGQLYRVPVFETPVGFKHIAQVMMREDGLMGGEESGGFGFRGHIPERDGILCALYFLSLMVKTGKRPSELVEYLYSRVGSHHYRRLDISTQPQDQARIHRMLKEADVKNIAGLTVIDTDRVDGRRFILPGAWITARLSGTEPLLRIYAEAESPEKVHALINDMVAFLGV